MRLLRLRKGNITSAAVNAVVTSANQLLVGAASPKHWRFKDRVSCDEHVHKVCGGCLREECLRLYPNGVQVGDAVVSKSFVGPRACEQLLFEADELEKKRCWFDYVIHAVGPTHYHPFSNFKLKCVYTNIFRAACDHNQISSIAVPAMCCGANGIRPHISANAAAFALLHEVISKTKSSRSKLDLIEFWFIDSEAHYIFGKVFENNGFSKVRQWQNHQEDSAVDFIL